MKDLQALTEIITPEKLTKIELLQPPSPQPSPVHQLYQGIRSGQFSDDQMAANHFYPTTPYQTQYYWTLKSRLETQLLNALIFLEPMPHETEIQKAHYQCYKILAVVHQLRARGIQDAAAKQARKALKKALQYDFSLVAFDMAAYLQYYYGHLVGDHAKFKKYVEISRKYQAQLQAEQTAQQYMLEISVHFAKSKTIDPQLIDLAKSYIKPLEELLLQFDSNRLHLYTYNLLIMTHEMESNHQEVIKTCDRALRFFEQKSNPVPASASFIFQFKKIPAATLLQDFRMAHLNIEATLQNLRPNIHNWHIVLQHQAILGFHAQELTLTATALKMYHHQKKCPAPNLREEWDILEAYYKFMTKDSKFRLPRFLNNVPTFSKDKRGHNINILIVQILFLLQAERYDQVQDRIRSLLDYSKRHLRANEDFRSNCFIKLLTTLSAGGFHKKRILPRAKKYLSKLKSLPLKEAKQPFELEIIPYEMLWDEIMSRLPNI